MKLAIFGGTFNPIHNGHIALARNFSALLKPDVFLFMPANIPPHKSAAELISAYHRLAMCEIAAQKIHNCTVSDYEITKEGTSYTIDTIGHFKQNGNEIYLIIGADMLLSMETWKNAPRIMERAVLCAAARENGQAEQLQTYTAYLESKYGAKVILADFPVLEMSSEEIRGRIRQGQSCDGMLLAEIGEYIKEHNLYK